MSNLKRNTASKVAESTDDSRAAIGEHLGETRDHLQAAANAAAQTVRNANHAAAGELRQGSTQVRSELGEAAHSGQRAAGVARDVAQEEWDAMLGKGQQLLGRSERWIQKRPAAAIGIAVASGFVLSHLLRRR